MNNNDDHTNDENNDSFCSGMSMTMSMSGFQSALFGAKKNKPAADCLTYLFHHWTLDSSGKFQGAMVYTFLLAVLCEGMSYSQSKVRHLSVLQSKPKVRKVIMMLLYGLQQCLGWALMLISMMFSLELFACVVVGVLVGKLIFPTEQLQNQYSSLRGQQGLGASDRSSTTTEGQPRRQPSTDDASHDLAVEDETTSPNRQGGRLESPAVRRRRR